MPLGQPPRRRYLMLNKPRGYVTTLRDEQGRRTVAELTADCGDRVYPIGRLDLNSEGLLLLTNDGEFANRLMHPRHEIEKTYLVRVSGFQTGAEDLLRRPGPADVRGRGSPGAPAAAHRRGRRPPGRPAAGPLARADGAGAAGVKILTSFAISSSSDLQNCAGKCKMTLSIPE